MSNTPTPHISAKPGDFAKTVLMPGDPLRAKFIAETFLENPVLVNNVRGIQGYTGTYKGKRVSVMASGMGMPSMGIYSYELFNFYGVENIIRVGSAGAINEKAKLRSIVLGMGRLHQFRLRLAIRPLRNPCPRCKLGAAPRRHPAQADRMGLDYEVGTVLSSDTFYNDSMNTMDWQKMGVLAIEMEAAALYLNAARAGKNAFASAPYPIALLPARRLTRSSGRTPSPK